MLNKQIRNLTDQPATSANYEQLRYMAYPPINALTPSSTPIPSRDHYNDCEGVNEDSPSEQTVARILKCCRIPTDKPQELPNYSTLAPTGRHPIIVLPAPINRLAYMQHDKDS